jgi:ethanolamine permease
MTNTEPQLARTLSGLHLWGIAVGLVISGEYFGWSYGWALAGTLGFLVSTVFIALMYTTFIFSYTELTTAIPHAGGPFAYSYRAFGPVGGYIAGFATLIEFVFAPPAIALAIGAYLNVQYPGLDARVAAVGAYVVFMSLNIVGVMIAATFELLVTVLAIGELLVFMGVVSGASSGRTSWPAAGQGTSSHRSRRSAGSSPRFRSRSGSSSPSKAPPWQPRRPRTHGAPFLAPTSAASSPW